MAVSEARDRGHPDQLAAALRASLPKTANLSVVASAVYLQPPEFETTAWLTMQSTANQSPQANSLLTGKLTGNFAESAIHRDLRV